MKAYKIALFLPLVGLVPMSAHAEPQDQMALAPAYAKKYRAKRVRYLPPPPPVAEVLPVVAPVPVYVPKPYSWTGFYVGGSVGASRDVQNPQFQVPTYGNLQGNDIGFGGSNASGAYNVYSRTYNDLANGVNSGGAAVLNTGTGINGVAGTVTPINGPATPGYTSYTGIANAVSYTTNANNTAIGATPGGVGYTPYNNLPGNRTDSRLTTINDPHRLLPVITGDIGYRKQFGLFVLGVEADGGFVDGKRSQTSNTQGQFSNSQGTAVTAQAAECFSGNGAGGCGSAGVNNTPGNVNVDNNGNSSFTQNVQAGPQWLGTARLSAGIAADRVLLYATGGLAYGQSNIAVTANYRDTANSVCTGSTPVGTNGSAGGFTNTGFTCNGGANGVGSSYTYSNAAQWTGNRSKFMTGFAIGTGAAFAVTDNVILKLEGIYYNLGSISTTAYGSGSQTLTVNNGNGPAGVAPGTRAASVTPFSVSRQIDGFIAKIGVAVKFDTGTPETVTPIYPVVAARY